MFLLVKWFKLELGIIYETCWLGNLRNDFLAWNSAKSFQWKSLHHGGPCMCLHLEVPLCQDSLFSASWILILESTQKSLHFWPSNMQFLHFFWIDIPAVQVGGALYGFNGQALLSCNWLPRRGDPCSGIAHQVPSISATTLKRRGCPTWREQRQNSAFITRN